MPPYTTVVFQANFKNSIQQKREDNYMIKVHSAFIENNTNIKCDPTFIMKATLHNNALPLIIINNLGISMRLT